VRRALAKSKGTSFWDLDLPRETREYVPRILALVDLLGDGVQTEFPVPADRAPVYETLELPHPVEVQELARRCGSPASGIRELNPSWLRPVTPGDGHPVTARVPAGAAEPVRNALADGTLREVKLSPAGLHRIRRGDTLWDISRHYRVSLNALLLVNGMSGKEVIRPGRTLRIPG
jgi:membrane-bound lytic murein transglycosylase D